MIYEILHFLKLQLEDYLSSGNRSGEPIIMLSNPWSNNENNQKSTFLNSISMINLEEEKVFRSQETVIRKENKNFIRKEPDLKLNVYVLISAYNKNYEDSLKFLSKVVSFFQQKNVFQRTVDGKIIYEGLPENCEKITAELYSVGFDQQNQIWASLSTGYIPSVIYKIRTMIIDVIPTGKEEKPIGEISVKSKQFLKPINPEKDIPVMEKPG